jgi:hypothetical protein
MESVTSRYIARHHVSALRPQLSSEPAYTFTPGLPSPGFTYPPASPVNYPPEARSDRYPKVTAPTLPLLDLARAQWYWNINQLCPFGKLQDVARLEAAAGRRYQLSDLTSNNTNRRLVSTGRLQLPNRRTKLLYPVRRVCRYSRSRESKCEKNELSKPDSSP